MTTWELADEAERRAVRLLLDELRRRKEAWPVLPEGVKMPGLEGLTKRDAGKLMTELRERVRGEG